MRVKASGPAHHRYPHATGLNRGQALKGQSGRQITEDETLTSWVKPKVVAEVKFTKWTNGEKCAILSIWACARTSEQRRSRDHSEANPHQE